MDTFLPRARQHAVIQQVGPALIVAGLIMTASGRADEGAAYAEEYCDLTEGTRAYRHMELADVVRLLVAASRTDRAAAVADNEVIPTFRNECESRTADATLALAGGDAGAFEVFQQAADAVEVVRPPARGAPGTRLGGRHPTGLRRRRACATARRRPPSGERVGRGALPALTARRPADRPASTRSRPVRNRPLSRSA